MEDKQAGGWTTLVDKEVRVSRLVGVQSRTWAGSGIREEPVLGRWSCRDTDKMPPKSPFVSD